MLVKATIMRNPAGQIVTEVIDRQEHLCSSVYNITNSVGRQVSDEDTGPECDPQTETTVDNG